MNFFSLRPPVFYSVGRSESAIEDVSEIDWDYFGSRLILRFALRRVDCGADNRRRCGAE